MKFSTSLESATPYASYSASFQGVSSDTVTAFWRTLATEMTAGTSGAGGLGTSPATRVINGTSATILDAEGRAVTFTEITGLMVQMRPRRNADGTEYPLSQQITAATTNASTTVTVPSTALLLAGMSISGTGIPGGATIASITDSTTFALSAAATATASSVVITASWSATADVTMVDLFAVPDVTLTGTLTSGNTSVTGLSSTANLEAGMSVSGTGITGGTTIASVDSTTAITLSANATASGAQSLLFTGISTSMIRLRLGPTSSTSSILIASTCSPVSSTLIETHHVRGLQAAYEVMIGVGGN